jgi:FAD/FMN-containing dehydrogenase
MSTIDRATSRSQTENVEEFLQTESTSLPSERLEYVDAWGGASGDMCYVYRPTNVDEIRALFHKARETGTSVGFRGAGNSYGDAAINSEGIVINLRRMNRILEWNPESGMVTLEPGVTIEDLWKYIIEDGWWVPIATGTAKTSIGGCAAMNVHGKNAWQIGPIGEHIFQFELLLPSGDIVTCSRDENSDLFFAAIGGFGMLGCLTSITLKMKRIYSGNLRVEALLARNMSEMLALIDEHARRSDYVVGWGDAFASGKRLGRGQIHVAHYLPPEADPQPYQTLQPQYQVPRDVLFGVLPASLMWMFMRPFWNNLGTRLVNTGKYLASKVGDGKVYRQSHAQFHFLLDYVPNWKRAYGPGGLIQYQPFVPFAEADTAFCRLLELGQKHGLPNYLTVIKRHRPDPFLMTHGLDGFSMAMDFRITKRNRQRIAQLCREMDAIILSHGGKFYFAKDSTLRPEVVEQSLGSETIERFRTLKQKYDPDGLLETNLWRRIFPN